MMYYVFIVVGYIYICIYTTYHAQHAKLAEDGKRDESVSVCDVDCRRAPLHDIMY